MCSDSGVPDARERGLNLAAIGAVQSVYGIAGTGSTIGTVISTWAVGRTLDVTHSYAPVFVGVGLLMPLAVVAGFALLRKVEPAKGLN
jgi:hypothetical protein